VKGSVFMDFIIEVVAEVFENIIEHFLDRRKVKKRARQALEARCRQGGVSKRLSCKEDEDVFLLDEKKYEVQTSSAGV